MPQYDFINPGAAITDSLVHFLAQRDVEKRQAMLDQLALQDRQRSQGRQDAADERARLVFEQQQADRAAALKAAQVEADEAGIVSTKAAIMENDRRNAIANYLSAAPEDKPALAEELALKYNIKVPVAPKSESEPVVRVNPRTGKLETLGEAPKGAHFVTEPAPPTPASPQPQIFVGDDGKPRAVVFTNGEAHEIALPPGVAGKTAPPTATQDQTNAAGFSARMADASNIINDNETNAADVNIQSVLPGLMQKDWFKQYDSAKRNWISAQLRKESGAAISESEYANADREYFPQQGDSAEVLKQKRRRREIAQQSMQRAAGSVGGRTTDGAPKLGERKTFRNGKVGEWDGQGWVQVQ
jgi:hypothetical protein